MNNRYNSIMTKEEKMKEKSLKKEKQQARKESI